MSYLSMKKLGSPPNKEQKILMATDTPNGYWRIICEPEQQPSWELAVAVNQMEIKHSILSTDMGILFIGVEQTVSCVAEKTGEIISSITDLTFVQSIEMLSKEVKQPKTGTFSEIEDKLVLFFRENEMLQLIIDKKRFSINDKTFSNWELKNNSEKNSFFAIFSLYEGDNNLMKLEYRPLTSRKIIPGDNTPFVDEEDYDFFIFVHNVLNDVERRNFIYQEPFFM